MSRGPGKIGRAIEALFDAERNNAFTLEELCERIYGVHRVLDPESTDPKRLRQTHRVAVARAARKVATRRPEIQIQRGGGLGGTLVFFRHDEVMSYAMAQLKTDRGNHYRSNDRRLHWARDEQALRKQLVQRQPLVEPGGAWWRRVQMFLAERAGDAVRLAELKAEQEQALAELAIRQRRRRIGRA
jgi:hypothetical protein